jgi:hypothetical protein
LEGCCSTIELHPLGPRSSLLLLPPAKALVEGVGFEPT